MSELRRLPTRRLSGTCRDQEYKYAKQSGGHGSTVTARCASARCGSGTAKLRELKNSVAAGAIPKEYIPAVMTVFRMPMGRVSPAAIRLSVSFRQNAVDGSYHEVGLSEMASIAG